MNFTREVKFDIGIIGAFGIEEPFALSQVNNMTIFVFGDIGLFVFYEIIQLFGILTG